MIPGYGMPDSKNPAIRGDLHLDYTVLFPRDMDTARREMVANALRNRPTNVTIPTTLVGISGYEPGKSFINFGGGSPEDPSTGVDFKREQSVVSSVWEPEAAGTGNDEWWAIHVYRHINAKKLWHHEKIFMVVLSVFCCRSCEFIENCSVLEVQRCLMSPWLLWLCFGKCFEVLSRPTAITCTSYGIKYVI